MGVTLTSALRSNLISLQNTTKLMDQTASRLATGLKVQSSLDDPVKFFAAKANTDRAGDLSRLKDDMGEAIQTVKAADEAISAITDLIASAKSLATSAKSTTGTSDIDSIRVQYQETLSQIDTLAADAGYQGVNLSNSSTTTLDVTFNEGGTSTLTITGFAGDATSLGVTDMTTTNEFSVAGGTSNTTKLDAAITALDSARDTLRTNATNLSNSLGIINTRSEFTDKFIGVLDDGAASLINADLNEEGANMLMLQTRQALGTTSLSIASQAAQSVLRLF